MHPINSLMAWAVATTAALAGMAAGFAVGWIAAGGRCGLGWHEFGPDLQASVDNPGHTAQRCLHCGFRRYRRFVGSD